MTHVAVIDIGKTNAKLALVDRTTLDEIAVVTRPNVVQPGPPWPHFDLEGHWAFLLENLREFHRTYGVDAISITAHGASIVLLDADGGLVAPMLDYEHTGPDDLAAEYDNLRPPFCETGSARLAGGLNVGAQLHWMFQQDPDLEGRTAQILTYPQYWAYRLTGIAATERTSLGCHTDLWSPARDEASSLVKRLGIDGKLAPVRLASDVLGPINAAVATPTGLPPDTPVTCGIHDSNASLLPHLISRTAPYSVVSSGTWLIMMSIGGSNPELDPERDTLLNVNAFGAPVPSARFMGGREYEMIVAGASVEPSQQDIAAVLDRQIMLAPALVPDTGPFAGRRPRWMPDEPPIGSGMRSLVAAYYCALVTSVSLHLIGHRGDVIVEGPFAGNPHFLQMLATATRCPVVATTSATGTSQGAALLVDGPKAPAADEIRITPADGPTGRAEYVQAWRAHCHET